MLLLRISERILAEIRKGTNNLKLTEEEIMSFITPEKTQETTTEVNRIRPLARVVISNSVRYLFEKYFLLKKRDCKCTSRVQGRF